MERKTYYASLPGVTLAGDWLLLAAGSTGRRNTVHPYRQEFEAFGLPATWLSDDPRLYKYE